MAEGATPIAAEQVLDLLDRAVVKGLVVIEDGRYRLIESVREYTREMLGAEDQKRAADAHFFFYSKLAENTEAKVRGPEQRKWIQRFDDEHENLRAALEWGFQSPPLYQDALEMLYNVTPYEFIKGTFQELLRRFEEALALDAHIDPDLKSRLLRRAGLMAMYNLDARAKDYYTAALEMAKKSGRQSTLADALYTFGNYLHINDDMEGARPFILDSLKKFKELGDVYGQGFALITLANIASFEGRDDEAKTLYEDSLRVRKTSGDLRGIGASLSALASLAMKQGHIEDARALVREGLTLFVEVGTPVDFADSVPRAAWYAVASGRAEVAAKLLGFSDATSQRLKGRRDRTDQGDYDKAELAARHALGLGDYERAWRSGKALNMAQAFELALTVLN